jgi:hypothetical protein
MHVEEGFLLTRFLDVLDGVGVGIWLDLYGVWVTTEDLYI